MSGSNPFRPRKQPEALPTTANSTGLSAVTPTTVPALPAAAAPTSDDVPHHHIPASSSSSTVDDTASSDDEDSTADPFSQASYLSDDGGNDRDGHDRPSTESTKNSVPVVSPPRRPLPVPPTGSRTASTSSSTDARPASISGSTTARRPSSASIDSRSLANRSANREKKPPPPPKSHHGKLINPPSPVESSKRLSFQGSSPAIQHSGPDYFTPGLTNNDDEKDLDERTPPDSLRRSQSHYKRPPTPPLSRRHSQMRRSKSSLSQTNPTRSPPSPGTVSLAPSMRQAPSRSSLSLQTDDNNTSSREDHYPAPSSPTEMSSPGKISARQTAAQGAPSAAGTAAAAAAAAAPPPPPPRRAARPASTMLPSKPGQEEGFPHPSNANHILEDLSRLQKEVDDLRGQYENRKSVDI